MKINPLSIFDKKSRFSLEKRLFLLKMLFKNFKSSI